MAILRKPLLPLGGRYDNVVIYRLGCGLVLRVLKPHTRKRILKDPRFAEFRKCSKRMAKASKIGSAVYKALPEDFRQFWMYRAFVGEALTMLKDQQLTGEEVMEVLFKTYVEVWYLKEQINEAEEIQQERTIDITRQKNTATIDIRWKQHNETIRINDHSSNIETVAFDKPQRPAMFRTVGMGPP